MADVDVVEATTAEVPEKISRILEMVSELTLLEASQLVKAFEEKFGVSVPQGGMGLAPQTGAAEAAEEEVKTEFDVVLVDVGPQKLQVIKVVRVHTALGLKDAKALVDSAPKPVKEAVSKEEADKVKAALEEVGATVELK